VKYIQVVMGNSAYNVGWFIDLSQNSWFLVFPKTQNQRMD